MHLTSVAGHACLVPVCLDMPGRANCTTQGLGEQKFWRLKQLRQNRSLVAGFDACQLWLYLPWYCLYYLWSCLIDWC